MDACPTHKLCPHCGTMFFRRDESSRIWALKDYCSPICGLAARNARRRAKLTARADIFRYIDKFLRMPAPGVA